MPRKKESSGLEWFKFRTEWRDLIATTAPEHVTEALLAIIDYAKRGAVLEGCECVISRETGEVVNTETKLLILAFKGSVDESLKNREAWKHNLPNGCGKNPEG